MFGKIALSWAKIDYFGRKMNKEYIDQTLNIDSIRRFLTRHESVFLFLALTLAFTVLLVVFGQPTSMTDFTSQHTALSPLGQVAIGLTSGFASLCFSRIALFLFNRSHELQAAACGIWLIAEMLICVSVMTLVLWAVGGAGPVQLSRLVADLVLGFVGIILIPYVITYLIFRLHEDKQEILRLRQELMRQDPAQQAGAEAKINFYDKGKRLAFSTKRGNILFIEAADNYVNIHYLNDGKEDTFILHNSLKEMEKYFSNTCLIRCHRGYIVNAENVKLMRKESTGLMLEINLSTKVIPVSKSYAESITQYFASNTLTPIPE